MRDCMTMQADREIEHIQQMFNVDEEQTLLQTPLIDTNQDRQSINTAEAREIYTYRGEEWSHHILPLDSKLSGEVTERKYSMSENREKGYLTAKQANYVYRMVESGNLINKNTMRQETD